MFMYKSSKLENIFAKVPSGRNICRNWNCGLQTSPSGTKYMVCLISTFHISHSTFLIYFPFNKLMLTVAVSASGNLLKIDLSGNNPASAAIALKTSISTIY